MTESVNAQDAGSAPVEGVVLIHGLGRTRLGMQIMAHRLERAGFRTACIGYRSRRLSFAEAVDSVDRAVARRSAGWDVVHLVGHSLGGVIASTILARHSEGRPGPKVGRAVMLGAPMRGSALAAWTGRITPLRHVFGPILAELAIAKGPRPPSDRVAAIAGTTGSRLVGREVGLHGLHDGKVTLRSAWSGAGHRAAVAVGHAMLPFSSLVTDLTAHFLRHGHFPAENGRAAVRRAG